MERSLGGRLLLVLLLLLGSACAVRNAQPVREASLSHPEPEGDFDRQREEWIESMHRAAPGVHWREIERENRLRNRSRLAETASLSAASSLTAAGAWLQRGPISQTGRTWVTALATDGNALLIGSGDEGGGLFSGKPGVWLQRGNSIGSGVQELVVVPGTPETWVTVGNNYSDVSVSRDQGFTWQTPGGLPSAPCGFVAPRLLREPGSRRVYLLVTVPYCVATTTYTLLRSDDGGLNFITVQSAAYTAVPDIWMDRVNGGPLYLLADSGLLSSSTFGSSFGLVGSLPAGSGDKLRLAGSEAGAPTFYAMRSNSSTNTNTLYASTNGGSSWSNRGTVADYSRSNGAFTASISNPNLLLLGGVDAYRSTDGGASFSRVNDWPEYYDDPERKLHADINGIDCFSYQDQETCFADTDGGTYMTTDLGANFWNMTLVGIGMINSEIYSTLTSKNDPDLIASGTQDQGLQQSTAESLVPMSFTQLISGDYGHLTSMAGDHNRLYAAYPGYLMVLDHEAAPHSIGSTVFPTARNRSWMPNILADPADANAVYLTGDPLYRLNQDSSGWHSTAFAQNFSNGNGDYLTALAISKVNSSYWYAASALGRLWYSHNQGATWTLSASLGPAAHYFYGTTLLPSTTVANTCYVGGSGYSGPAVYKTTDGGATWQAMGTGLPSTLVLGLAFDDPAKQTLFAAADAGPFTYDTASGSWKSLVAGNAPIQGYWSVEGVPALQAVRFGTYGKGVWDYRLVPPGRDFYSTPPCRLIDTRVTASPALQPQFNRVFTVEGRCGIPSTARALSVNIVAVPGPSSGFFTFGASDKPLPSTSTVNFTASSVRGNNALLELSTEGAGGFVVFNGSQSPAHLILDVNGYFQ